jgi:carboxylesterase
MGEYPPTTRLQRTRAPLRPRHHPRHARSSYTDWLASVEDGFALLSGAASAITVMGLSMGGILALSAAATLPVNGVVAMSTPYKLPDDPRLRHIECLSKLVPYMPKGSEEPGAGWFDKQAFKEHVSYPQNPLHAIGELNKLLSHMRALLPEVRVPALLIHSRDDDYVVKDSMPRIYDDLGTSDKRMLWIEGSGHVITRDAQRQTVFENAANFVLRLPQPGQGEAQ